MAGKKKKIKAATQKKLVSNSLILMLVCAALVTVGIVLLFFSLFAIYKVYQIDMSLEIADHSAFDIETDSISFGKAVPGNSNSRTIVMSHDYKKPLLIHFKKSGNISQFVTVPEDFYLEPGLTREIQINAIIPKNSVFGSYEGSLTVYFRRI